MQASIQKQEENMLSEICSQEDNGWTSDFQQIIPFLLYLYQTKVIAQKLLESNDWNSDYMKSFQSILYLLIKNIKHVMFGIIETLKSTEACIMSIESELFKIVQMKKNGGLYQESFCNNILIAYLVKAIESITSGLGKNKFTLIEDELKCKIIEVSSGVVMIKDSIKNLEGLRQMKKTFENDLVELKKKNMKLVLLIKLIILCKNYFACTKKLSNGFNCEEEIKNYELDLKLVLQEILGRPTLDTDNLYNIMGKINKALFEKYRKVVSHESCQVGFQSNFSSLVFNETYDFDDYNALYSFLDQPYTDLFELAQSLNVYMKLRNNADRALLILFLNYQIFHFAIKMKNPNFSYFSPSGCSEMGPFLEKEENTDFTLSNFLSLLGRIPKNVDSKKVLEKLKILNKDIQSQEEFLLNQCQKFGANSLSSLMEILMNLQKIRIYVFGDFQILLFSNLLKMNSEMILDYSHIVDDQTELIAKYEVAFLLSKGKEVKNFKYLLGEMKNAILS